MHTIYHKFICTYYYKFLQWKIRCSISQFYKQIENLLISHIEKHFKAMMSPRGESLQTIKALLTRINAT